MSARRYLFLDALRGIAALLVAWHHSAQRLPLRWPDAPSDGAVLGAISASLNFGAAGVVAFFLISGFVIPSSLGKPHPGALKAFFIRRFFRLYPAFWVSVAQAIALGLAVAGTLPPARKLLANLTMGAGFFGQPHLQGMYWTLQMELVFYAVCALLFRFGRLRDGAFLSRLSLALLALFVALWIPFRRGALGSPDPDFLYLPFILSLMFLGALCRKAYDAAEAGAVKGAHEGVFEGAHEAARPGARSIVRSRLRGWFQGEDARNLWIAGVPWLLFPTLLILLPLSGDAVILASPARFGTGHLLGVALFACAVAWLRARPSRVFLFLGLISYSLYLFHGFAIDLVIWAVEDSGLEFLRGRSFRFYLGFMLLTAVAISTISYACVEKPFIALGRRLSQRFGTRSGAGPKAAKSTEPVEAAVEERTI